jgi:hypothetical protein
VQRRRNKGSDQGPAVGWRQDTSGKSLAAAEQVSLSRKSLAGADLER